MCKKFDLVKLWTRFIALSEVLIKSDMQVRGEPQADIPYVRCDWMKLK